MNTEQLEATFSAVLAESVGVKPGPYRYTHDGDLVEAHTRSGELVARIGRTTLQDYATEPGRCPTCGQVTR